MCPAMTLLRHGGGPRFLLSLDENTGVFGACDDARTVMVDLGDTIIEVRRSRFQFWCVRTRRSTPTPWSTLPRQPEPRSRSRCG